MKPEDAVSLILKNLAKMAIPGVKTSSLDLQAEQMIKDLGFFSYNKGYQPEWAKSPWGYATCISVNSCIAHGKPSPYVLKEGDIVSLDLGIYDQNHDCADAALTVGVGQIENVKQRLLYYTKQTVYEAIKHMHEGVDTEDLAKIIEYHALSRGYLVNRRFAGHAIGKEMHEKPNIYNTCEPGHNYTKLKAGQVFCVEIMMTRGKDNLGGTDPEGWSFWTGDMKDSALFEHMVRIESDHAEILTSHFEYKQGEA